MKLIVVIPAYNEEKTISKVIKGVPRNISGVDRVEVLVIDDGSRDKTAEKARKGGADYVIPNRHNRGLAFSFKRALEEALKFGADIIVNIDADFQYRAAEIPKLIKPILEGRADMVIGNRNVRKLKHMPLAKRWGNVILSGFMRFILQNKVSDASSGFRAFSKKCASKIDITSKYTYTHESIIQCRFLGMNIKEVSIEFRAREDGKSRLIRNLFRHIILSGITILKTYFKYAKYKRFTLSL